MKNILFFEQFSNISGGQKVLLNIISAVKDRFNARVILPAEGELSSALKGMDIETLVLPIGSYSAGKKSLLDVITYFLRTLYLLPVVVRIIKRTGADILYANAPRTFLLSALAGAICRKPVIWHLHSILKGIELRFIARLARAKHVRMIAVSQAVREPLIKLCPALSEKIKVVHNGIDPSPYLKSFDKARIKNSLGLDENSKVIGYIGQITKWKGVEELVEAFVNVARGIPSSRLVVIGEDLFGRSGRNKFKCRLAEIISRNDLKDRILFLGRRGDIPDLLSVIDVLAIPSIEPDPCPLVLLEGMAAGKAVVAFGHGGVAEIIESGVDGLLYEPKNIGALEKCLTELLNEPEKVLKLGFAAREKVQNAYLIGSQISAIVDVLRRI